MEVKNFHTSWGDGLAFCAILHRHHPDLIPWNTLSKVREENNLMRGEREEREFKTQIE